MVRLQPHALFGSDYHLEKKAYPLKSVADLEFGKILLKNSADFISTILVPQI
jgi:hypothetical protein